MFHSALMKSLNLLTAAMMTLQPVLGAIPPEVVRARPAAEVAPQPAEAAPSAAAEKIEPLTATVPLTAAAPERTQSSANQRAASYDGEPVYLLEGDKLWRTRNFMDATPDWADITGMLADLSFRDLYLEETDPYNKAWLATGSGVWYTDNLDTEEPTWVQKSTFSANTIFRHPSGKMMATGGGTLWRADSNGNNWQAGNPRDTHDFWEVKPWVSVSPSGSIFGIAYSFQCGPCAVPGLVRSKNYGQSWPLVGAGYPHSYVHHYGRDVLAISDSEAYFQVGGDLWHWVAGAQYHERIQSDLSWYYSAGLAQWPGGDLMAIAGGTAYRILNGGTTREAVAQFPSEGFGSFRHKLYIWPDQQHMAWVQVATDWSHQLVRSEDGGQTWSSANGEDVGWGYYNATGALRSPALSQRNVAPDEMTDGEGDCDIICEDETTGGPIDTRTGNKKLSQVDLGLPTQAGTLAFTRSYSSFNAQKVADGELPAGVMSPGWFHNYERRLIFHTDPYGILSQIGVQMPGGSRARFYVMEDGSYQPEPGFKASLEREGTEGNYTYIYHNTRNEEYRFNNDGQFVNYENSHGRQLALDYSNGRLQKVFSPDSGRALFMEYDSQDRLEAVRTVEVTSDGTFVAYLPQSVAFDYDANGDLETFTDLRGQEWDYQYGDPDYPHFMTARLDPLDGIVLSYEYDEQGRAFRETNGAGEVMAELVFDTDGTTEVIYGDGGVGGSQTHEYDFRHTLVGQANDTGGSSTTYDYNFRPRHITDPNGHPTGLAWSDDGANLEGVTDALGNPTGFAYDADHHLTLVDNVDGTQTYFVYNFWGDPDGCTGAPTDPLTGADIGDCAWDEDLLLMQIDNYAPDNPGVDANQVTRYYYTDAVSDPDEPPNLVKRVEANCLATCYSYNAFGQQTGVVQDCDGEAITTTYLYDDAGRLTDVTQAVGTDAESTTHYIYVDGDDRADEIISHYDELKDPYEDELYNLATRTFTDALGRTVATVSNYHPGNIPTEGTVESVQFDFDGGGTDATLQLSIDAPEYNQVSLTRYDDAGRAYESISSYWPGQDDYYLNKYNIRTHTFYDGAGRVVATVNNYHPGTVPGGTTHDFDFDNDPTTDPITLQLSSEAPEFNQVSLTVYDSVGRVSRTVTNYDGDNIDDPTKLYKDGGYNLVSATEYDAAGNVLKSVTNFKPLPVGDTPEAGDVPVWLGPTTGELRWIHIDGNAPDINQLTCTQYDALNRPEFTRAACLPPDSLTYGGTGQWETYQEYLEAVKTAEFIDYQTIGDNLYNLVSRTIYDNMGRQIATVRNYEDPDEDGKLVLSPTRNFITRTYYDELGRVSFVVENYSNDARLAPGAPAQTLGQVSAGAKTMADDNHRAVGA
ncbi:MAG: RHS repeat protein, partial [Anaerolineae bacterium]|nr:RHS repeat protein [Anaerolineae bacterium]